MIILNTMELSYSLFLILLVVFYDFTDGCALVADCCFILTGIINDVSGVILSLIALTEDEICNICPQLSEEWGFLL